jgi:SAM-dependent methyltransferase
MRLTRDSSPSVRHCPEPPRRSESTAGFDQLADDYDALLRDPVRDLFARSPDFFHRRKWDLIQAYLKPTGLNSRSMAWLDVGCGRGELLRLGKDSFRQSVGCDPSREMIRYGSGEIYWQPEPSELPFAAQTFDLVTAVCVFHHVPFPQRPALASEVFRLLRPKGVFCVIEHNPFNPITRRIVARTPVDRDARLLSAGYTKSMLSRAGFDGMDTRYFLFAPERWYANFGWLEAFLKHCPAGGQYAVFATKSPALSGIGGE